MCVRAARDRARMWQIGPRISSAYGLLRSTPIIVLRALGGAQPTFTMFEQWMQLTCKILGQ